MQKMRLRQYLLGIIAIAALALAALYISKDYIAIHVISKKYNLEMSYKNLKWVSCGRMEFRDFKVVEKRTGLGVSSRSAAITLDRAIGFDLYDVRFVKSAGEKAASYDNITELVSIPFNSQWTYKQVSGKISESAKGIKIEDFMATGEEIKLSFNGSVHYDNTIDSKIIVYFNDKLTEKIPPELSRVVLQDEKGGWKSLAVALKGDYKAPSIQISSKLFRLSIKEASP